MNRPTMIMLLATPGVQPDTSIHLCVALLVKYLTEALLN
jgi:hypothetical protein